MNDDLDPRGSTVAASVLGDRIRNLTSQLRQERDVQIKATARVLGAAAQIATNHDHLIEQVVEMVETDLNQPNQRLSSAPYTVDRLKQQFKSLKDAKTHFNLKANSWDALVSKLNEPSVVPSQKSISSPDAVTQKLDSIEQELQCLQRNMSQVLNLLTVIMEKLP